MKPINGKRKLALEVWGELAISINGLEIEIVESSSKELEGVKGIIISETANMIKIAVKERTIWVQKANQIFKIKVTDGSSYLIKGEILQGKPETRVKKKFQF